MAGNGANATDPRASLLNRVFDDMIIKNFKRMPMPLQAFVYFLFVIFFLMTGFRLVAGDYVVTGVLWEGGRHPRDCEIQMGDGLFTLNSNGIYYVILGSTDYWLLASTRSTTLPIVRHVLNEETKKEEPQRVGDFKISLKRFSLDEFEAIDLKNPKGQVTDARPSLTFDLISSAYAQLVPSTKDRLYVQTITLGPTSKTRRAEFKLDVEGQKKAPLLSFGLKAGNLPLRSLVPVALDGRYFEISPSLRGRKAELELDAKDGALWGDNEDFEFTIPTTPKTIFVKGERNSVMQVTFVPAGTDPRAAMHSNP